MHSEKLYKYCIGSTKQILCDKQVSLKASKLERFHSNALTEKLMENFLLGMLDKNSPLTDGIKIGFYDPEAEFPSFAEKLLSYCSNLIVVSFMPKFYEIEANRILQHSGAVMTATNSLEQLSNCDMIIAPEKIKRPLPSHQNTVIFTVCEPSVHMPGIIITGYDVDIPEEYAPLKPDSVDTDYFLSGLYSLCTVTSLAGLQPYSCHTETVSFSADDTFRLIPNDCK